MHRQSQVDQPRKARRVTGSFHILVQKVLKKHHSFFDLQGYRVIVEKRGTGIDCLSEATVKVCVDGETESTVVSRP